MARHTVWLTVLILYKPSQIPVHSPLRAWKKLSNPKTAADTAPLFKIHPATVSRLLARAYAK